MKWQRDLHFPSLKRQITKSKVDLLFGIDDLVKNLKIILYGICWFFKFDKCLYISLSINLIPD